MELELTVEERPVLVDANFTVRRGAKALLLTGGRKGSTWA
jgi:hypothetical protein